MGYAYGLPMLNCSGKLVLWQQDAADVYLAQQRAGLLWQHALGRGGSPSGDARAGEHPAKLRS